jgi:acyl carrier protein
MIATHAKVDVANLASDADLREDLRLRSLDVLVLCENLEQAFEVKITDEEAASTRTARGFANLVASRANGAANRERIEKTAGPPGSELRDDGTLQTDIEISMQLLGLNGLAETPLLMRVADLRWQHMAAVAGIRTRDVVDDEGDRLYAAVYFVETSFTPARPMGTFLENDRISVLSTLERFGTSLLDGRHYVFPLDLPNDDKVIPRSPEEAAARDIPWLRISNSFVKKRDGAGWLKKSRPSAEGFTRIREVATPPSSYDESSSVKERGRFFDVPGTYVPLTPEPVVVDYDIVPDRDMNGAGLLYFAMYPAIMDVAERRVLGESAQFESDVIDRRTLVHRKTAYFSNAPAHDKVRTALRIWIESPYRTGVPAPEMAPIRLLEQIELRRISDDRLMAISGAKKIVMGFTLGDTTLLPLLERDR